MLVQRLRSFGLREPIVSVLLDLSLLETGNLILSQPEGLDEHGKHLLANRRFGCACPFEEQIFYMLDCHI